MKEDYIIEADLNKALEAKEDKTKSGIYHSQICIMAQFAMRVTGKIVLGSTSSAACFVDFDGSDYPFKVYGAHEIVPLFDTKHYSQVRAMLPLKVRWEFQPKVATSQL